MFKFGNILPVIATTALLLSTACGGEDGGTAGELCEEDADCADNLVCDMHDDEGTCQDDHDH